MTKVRIHKNRFYVFQQRKTGYGKLDIWEVVTGAQARSTAYRVANEFVGEYQPREGDCFRLQNGRAPEHQPIVGWGKAQEWLKNNPFQEAVSTAGKLQVNGE